MAASDRTPHPGLLLLAFMGLGRLLEWLRPLEPGLPFAWRAAGTAGLWGSASVLLVWALVHFRRQGTSPEPNHPVTALITAGPYRWSRNPLYLANVAVLGGFGLLLDSGWGLLLTGLQAAILHRWVVLREEHRLAAQFGETYRAYCARVRRWL